MKILIKYNHTLLILILFVQPAYSQNKNYSFTHLDVRSGLAGEDVIGFAQDVKGFIWIATDNGLQRFDGRNFVTYRHTDKDSTSLSVDETFLPMFDKENNLWLQEHEGCINIFNTHTKKVIKLNPEIRHPGEIKTYFVSHCKDAEGTIWISSTNALYKYSYREKKTRKIADFPDSLLDHNIEAMACDTATGNIWISTAFGMIEYNQQHHTFFDFNNNPSSEAIFNLHSEPYCIYIDSRRNLWFSTWQGELYRYNLNSHFLKKYYFKTTLTTNPNSMVGGIIEDKNSNIWIGANSSDIFYYDSVKDTLLLAVKHFIEKPSSSQTNINSMFCDNENNIWIATAFGPYFFNPSKQKIFSVINNPFDIFSLPPSQVETFGESKDGLIWISSRDGGGLSIYDQQMNLVKRLFYNGDKKYKTYNNTEVSASCNDKFGKLWMASYHTLICYDPQTKEINTIFTPELSFYVHSMICDETNIIWIGGSSSIIEFNPATHDKKIFTNFSEQYINNPARIEDLVIDGSNNIWAATLGDGISLFNKQTGKFDETFMHDNKNIHSLSSDNCICLSIYNTNTILVGTDNGISLFDLENKQFDNIFNTDGMLSNTIHGINRDQSGNIFIATTNGLYEIDSATHTFTSYNFEDGIIDNQFYSKIFKLNDGQMLAGGLNSFIYFNPQDLNERFIPPDVQITGYKIFDTQYQNDSIPDSSNTIHLSYNQNFITLQYAALYYNSPAEIHYYYKLDGVDKKWVNAGMRRNAVYTALEDGNYTFEVKCTNDNRIACKNITLLHINIATPYYNSWWFILLCIVAFAAIIYAAYNYRVQGRRNLAFVRRRIASDLHDDIGSTLNSISVYSEVANQQLKNNSDQARIIVEKMGSASRKMIDTMNDIVWAINPKNDDFENILQRMQYFAGELLSSKNILLQFDADENIKKIKLPMDKRKNFYLIYKEAINNAYKYADSNNVNVSIAEQDNMLIMIITDNGKGFDIIENHLGGNGMKNMKIRAKEIGANIDITSWPGKGTRVYLKMKV